MGVEVGFQNCYFMYVFHLLIISHFSFHAVFYYYFTKKKLSIELFRCGSIHIILIYWGFFGGNYTVLKYNLTDTWQSADRSFLFVSFVSCPCDVDEKNYIFWRSLKDVEKWTLKINVVFPFLIHYIFCIYILWNMERLFVRNLSSICLYLWNFSRNFRFGRKSSVHNWR